MRRVCTTGRVGASGVVDHPDAGLSSRSVRGERSSAIFTVTNRRLRLTSNSTIDNRLSASGHFRSDAGDAFGSRILGEGFGRIMRLPCSIRPFPDPAFSFFTPKSLAGGSPSALGGRVGRPPASPSVGIRAGRPEHPLITGLAHPVPPRSPTARRATPHGSGARNSRVRSPRNRGLCREGYTMHGLPLRYGYGK